MTLLTAFHFHGGPGRAWPGLAPCSCWPRKGHVVASVPLNRSRIPVRCGGEGCWWWFGNTIQGRLAWAYAKSVWEGGSGTVPAIRGDGRLHPQSAAEAAGVVRGWKVVCRGGGERRRSEQETESDVRTPWPRRRLAFADRRTKKRKRPPLSLSSPLCKAQRPSCSARLHMRACKLRCAAGNRSPQRNTGPRPLSGPSASRRAGTG